MDDKKEEGTTGACASKGGCGMHCGCCGCKAIKGLVLLLIGGFIGYGIGHCQHSRWMHRTMCPMMTPAAPAQSESAAMPTAAPKKGK